MIVARKPADIIEGVLLDIAYGLDCGDAVRSEDVIDALESEGWYFVWSPDQDVRPTHHMRRVSV